MTRHAARRFADSLLVLSMFLLAACGSGGVSGPAVTTGALAISPATATVYSDVPSQFVITGGTAPYFITTSNGTALPVPSAPFNYNTLTLVPGTVGSDTAVTLSATDAKNSTTVSATVTVKPRTISNVVTVTPTVSCNGALCAGSDALVRVVLSQNGVPLVGRAVRFSVASGALSVVTSSGGTDALSSVGTAVTDANGAAAIRVRADPGAAPQTALLDVTDVTSGYTVRTPIAISSASTVTLNAQPSTLAFQGTDAGTCASGISADVIVFGGTPPYQVSQPGAFLVSPTLVTSSGGRFRVTATGQCATATPIAVVDAAGATVAVTATNKLSDLPVTSPTTPFVVSPTGVALSSCNDIATVSLAGGSGTYFATSGNSSVRAVVNNNVGTISRYSTSSAPGASTVDVQFSDGKTTQTVSVALSGEATGACPPPAASTPLTVNPNTVTLTSCSDVANVLITGGAGSITVSPRNTGISAFRNFSTGLTSIQRFSPSAPITSPTYVDVTDGSTVTSITVNLTGAGAGSC